MGSLGLMRIGILALACLGVWCRPAEAADLRIAVAAGPLSVDPYFYNGPNDKGLSVHIFSRLVEQTADTKLEPGLALSWHALSDTLWEFKLRPGVMFQDGTSFTPDDVVFSFARAPFVRNSPSSFAPMLRTVAQVEVIDPQTLRIHTSEPNPNLPADLANIAIISRHAAAGATTADYNAGRAAVGTGPYKLISFTAGEQVVLQRNPTYFGEKPAWDQVTFRVIPNPGARTAALLAGDVDLIEAPSVTDLPRLRGDSRLRVASTLGTRMVFLRLDRSRSFAVPDVTARDGTALPQNPFNDLRVRKALSLAINREGIADRVMAGTVVPTGQWLAPGVYSYNPAISVPRYDPDAARSLLAEAGYGSGFKLAIHAAAQPETMQAVASMWTRIGVLTTVDMLPPAIYATRAARQDFGVSSGGWGSNSGEAGYFLVNVLATYDKDRGLGPFNWGRYSNSALDSVTRQAMATIDDTAREALLRHAEQIAMDDVAVIPIFQIVNYWATRSGIAYEARADERTIAMSARPAP